MIIRAERYFEDWAQDVWDALLVTVPRKEDSILRLRDEDGSMRKERKFLMGRLTDYRTFRMREFVPSCLQHRNQPDNRLELLEMVEYDRNILLRGGYYEIVT